jgi:hypothetical protein
MPESGGASLEEPRADVVGEERAAQGEAEAIAVPIEQPEAGELVDLGAEMLEK